MTRSKVMGLAAGVLLAFAAFGFVLWQGSASNTVNTASAQGAPTTTPAAQAPNPSGTMSDMVNAFWQALASKLGITTDDLKSKVVASQKDVIEQAVKDGKLTRAQADAMEQRLNTTNPVMPFGGRGGFERGFGKGLEPGGKRGFPWGVNTLEAVAAVLNMKPADLNTQLQSKTLADIAKAQNVDEAKVKQAIIDAYKTDVQREVQDGLITQAQADQMLANLTPDKIDLTQTHGFEGHGGPGGPGGFGH